MPCIRSTPGCLAPASAACRPCWRALGREQHESPGTWFTLLASASSRSAPRQVRHVVAGAGVAGVGEHPVADGQPYASVRQPVQQQPGLDLERADVETVVGVSS